jgi:predicted dehydrogenase
MIRAAILGLGRWGQALVEAAARSEELRIVAAVEPDATRASPLAATHGFRLLPDLDAALAEPGIEAVMLATPHSQHAAQVRACAAAGRAVFCEKPLSLSLAEAEDMVEACRRGGVPLAVGHNRRFWPAMQALERMVAAGELGTLLHLEGHNSNEHSNALRSGWRLDPAESPAGGLTGAGLHVLHAFVSLCGAPIQAEAWLKVHRAGPPPLDSLAAFLEFPGGVTAQMATIRATPAVWRIHAFGDRASAEVLGEGELILRRSGAAPERITLPARDTLRDEMEAFAAMVGGNKPYPVTPRQVLDTVRAFEMAVAAVEKKSRGP